VDPGGQSRGPGYGAFRGGGVRLSHSERPLDHRAVLGGRIGTSQKVSAAIENADGSVRSTSRSRLSEAAIPIAQDFGQI
jgi:hypothetical protein